MSRNDYTAGQHSFARIVGPTVPRSVFDRSCGLKTTFNAGYLVPIFVDEALPGDTFDMSAYTFARMPTMLHPVMENIHLDYFFFSIPYRLVWNNWQRFNGEKDNPDDSTDYEIPQMVSPVATGYEDSTLHDYFGLPTQVPELTHSALPLRAYNLVWNEWFRDQNLQDSVVVDKDDGPDDPADYVLLRRGKRHDYFTSCLPFPQKGPAVELPLGATAPVIGVDDEPPIFRVIANATNLTLSGTSGNSQPNWGGATPGATGAVEWQQTGLVADLATATAATVNDLREAFQVQRMFERDARGGSRYTELLRSHFGVVSDDARLQRPEYLGGGTSRININPVAATAQTSAVQVEPGDLAAFGTSSSSGIGFRKSFTEHCIIIGMVAARADLTYQDGLERMWSRLTRFDFYWPSLAHLGEQAVLNKEIYATAVPSWDEEPFGYQERFAEYRYKPSRVVGKLRSNLSADSLDTWHLAQEFSAGPLLNAEFIEENPPINRIVGVYQTTQPAFIMDCFFQFRCTRPMPTFSVPGLIDHF